MDLSLLTRHEVLAVLPAALAVLALPLGRRALPAVPLVALLVLPAGSILVALGVLGEGPAMAEMGGWSAPLGILLRADGTSAVFLLMTSAVCSAIGCYALGSRRRSAAAEGRQAYSFWILFLLLWSGLNTVFLSRDLFNLYVALEVTSLSGVAMVALTGSGAALLAQMRYLLFATFGSLLYLMGVALIYAATGALDIGLVAGRLAPGWPATMALVLASVGLLLKSAIWPMHFWLPPAHSAAPPPVSAALSGLVVKASLYVLVRLWFEVFPGHLGNWAWTLAGVLGAVAVLWGSLLALRQERLKLMIAYSTMAQLGYVLFIFPLASQGSAAAAVLGWAGAMLHVVAHGIAKAAMFLAAGAMVAVLGGDRLSDLRGATRRVPVPLFALALAALSVMGLPPSGGFLAKWLMLRSAVADGQWWLAGVLVGGGLLAAAYIFRFLAVAFRPMPPGAAAAPVGSGLPGAAAMALALLALLLGLVPVPVMELLGAPPPRIAGHAP